MQIEIRRPQPCDAPKMWEVRTRAIRAIEREHYDEQSLRRWAQVPLPDGFAEVLARQPALVAEVQEQILGWGLLNLKRGQLEALFVDPPSQRSGVGAQLSAALHRAAVDAGLRSLSVSATLNAVGFYERIG